MGLVSIIGRFGIFVVCHSLLAVPAVKERLCQRLGRSCRFYRLTYNVLSLILFGWVLAAWPFSPVLYFLPGAWSLAGYLGQVMLLVALIRCIAQTGLGDFVGFASTGHELSAKLITTGSYRHVRHPLYSLSMLFFFLNPVMTEKWLTLSIMATLYFLIGAVVEERRLIRHFGSEYAQYQQTVPMFVPTLRYFKKGNVSNDS
jgi:methanethiol S-methyltransferase